jgi:prepilin-type N-terminal cleavage/methylation domain-containing protein
MECIKMECTKVARSGSANREGFTLIELLISLTLSVVVMGASLGFAMAAFRGSEGNTLREEVYRNARFIGMALERDIQTTGVGVVSEIRFGTLSTFNDTLVILHVPWEPTDAFPYTIDPPNGTDNPLPAGGTCGTNCIDFNSGPGNSFDLVPGDIARLQVNAERRVILITDVRRVGNTYEVTFAAAPTLLHYESALSGGLLLDRFSTIVQKLQPVIYWVENEVLYRSDQLDASGNLIGSPLAYDVKAWDAKMIFVDLDEADEGDPYDADDTNEFDDILGVRLIATLGTTRSDIRVAGGELYTREYEWKFLPRNLMYERNR